MCICINLLDTGRAKLRYLSVLKSSSGSDVPAFCDLLQDTWAIFCGRFSIWYVGRRSSVCPICVVRYAWHLIGVIGKKRNVDYDNWGESDVSKSDTGEDRAYWLMRQYRVNNDACRGFIWATPVGLRKMCCSFAIWLSGLLYFSVCFRYKQCCLCGFNDSATGRRR